MSIEAGTDMSRRASPAPRAALAAGIIVIAVTVFAITQTSLWERNGYWLDEYFSMWASDPTAPFFSLFAHRILPDTNPPIFLVTLAVFRWVIEDPRVAFIAVSIATIATTSGFVLRSAWRSDVKLVGAGCVAAFIVSGPVVCYAPEGRAYLFAMCVTLAIAWAVAMNVRERRESFAWAWLGILAALTHAFAAIFAGAMAAGLLLEGLFAKRRDLVRAGLLLGFAVVATFLIWLFYILPRRSNVGWIEFTPNAIRVAAWYVKQLAFGSNFVLLMFGAFLAWSITIAKVRPLIRVFGVCAMLFALLPLLASFHIPLIVGRYWLIGAPALVVLVVFTIREHLLGAASVTGGAAAKALIPAVIGGVALLGASAGGAINAGTLTAQKPIWRGADRARKVLADCPAGSVHINGSPELFALASAASPDTFVRVDAPNLAPRLDARVAPCTLLGWGEHVMLPGGRSPEQADDRELLSTLKISGEPGVNVEVVRHSSGFVVLRRPIGGK